MLIESNDLNIAMIDERYTYAIYEVESRAMECVYLNTYYTLRLSRNKKKKIYEVK